MSLLPPNASELQRHLAELNQFKPEFELALKQIRELKNTPSDELLHWLVWEYGLEAILPYSSDMRQMLTTGLNWQRIRGTPGALKMALLWLGIVSPDIEHEAPGRHFYEYQIDPGKVPGDEDITRIINLARMSAPVRSRLARIFHDYDVRKLKLSEQHVSEFGHLLSDYSGIAVEGGETKLSFSRKHSSAASATEYQQVSARKSLRTDEIRYIKEPILGEMTLSERYDHGVSSIRASVRQLTSGLSYAASGWLGKWTATPWSKTNFAFIGVNHTSVLGAAIESSQGSTVQVMAEFTGKPAQ
ncbi:phage tail protein [Thalassomonas actiniarum]|uniref:Phage tail protein n=1 Tax=Thalassomonas actiniarum TaxID=485447 RepID=A0AAF0C2X5_9GAMM|nr:phage tail protein [Thalassomonas actiniarum]WDD98378.1 phage tail protein [Thalassomonas actiniarum]